MVKSVAKGQLTRVYYLTEQGERNTTVVYGPEKRKKRRGVREELVCSVLGAGLSLAGERPPSPSQQLLCVAGRAQGQHRVRCER